MTKRFLLVSIFVITAVIIGFLWQVLPSLLRKPKDLTWVVLITMDTARADHLGCYGYERDTSPNIDLLASSGVRFENCYAAMPTTDPSHASIMTSTYPRVHGVIMNGQKISNTNVLSLAEVFKRNGYSTAAITARAALSPDSLGLQGFDYMSAPERGRRKAEEISEETIAVFEKHRRKNLFIWIHFFDPHTPYRPPAPYDSFFNDGNHILGEQPRAFTSKALWMTDDEIAYYISLYDGAIRYMDFHIGKLLRWLDEASSDGSLQSFIILTADHGETLEELKNEKYIFAHSKFLHQSAVRIPLIISYKGIIPQGMVRDTLVESLDISPTIVDILFEKKFDEFTGTSMKKCIFDELSLHKPYAFIHRRPFASRGSTKYRADLVDHAFGIVSRDYKLIENPVSGLELYDLVNDNSGHTDLIIENEEIAGRLKKELEKWKEDYPLSTSNSVVPKEKQEILKSLGYLP